MFSGLQLSRKRQFLICEANLFSAYVLTPELGRFGAQVEPR